MRGHRTGCLLVVIILLGASALPMIGLAATDTTDRSSAAAAPAQLGGNATPATDGQAGVSPGEHFAGVLGVQEAELNGTIESRTLGISIANATSNASKATVVRARLARIEHRLDALHAQRRALEAAYENGSITTGQYRARTAILVAQTRSVRDLANESETVALALPPTTREAHGINVTAIRTLRNNASTLTGHEVAEIARSIAGDNAGRSIPRGPPIDRDVGPPDRSPRGTPGPPDVPRTPPVDPGNTTPDRDILTRTPE